MGPRLALWLLSWVYSTLIVLFRGRPVSVQLSLYSSIYADLVAAIGVMDLDEDRRRRIASSFAGRLEHDVETMARAGRRDRQTEQAQ